MICFCEESYGIRGYPYSHLVFRAYSTAAISPQEEILNVMLFPVDAPVMCTRLFPIGLRGHAMLQISGYQSRSERIRITSLASDRSLPLLKVSDSRVGVHTVFSGLLDKEL